MVIECGATLSTPRYAGAEGRAAQRRKRDREGEKRSLGPNQEDMTINTKSELRKRVKSDRLWRNTCSQRPKKNSTKIRADETTITELKAFTSKQSNIDITATCSRRAKATTDK